MSTFVWQLATVVGWSLAMAGWAGFISSFRSRIRITPIEHRRPVTELLMDMSDRCRLAGSSRGPIYLPLPALLVLAATLDREMGTDQPCPFTGKDQRIYPNPERGVEFDGIKFLPWEESAANGVAPSDGKGWFGNRVFDNAEDDFAFMVKNMETGQEWKIYQDGQTEGWSASGPIVIINRIPRLVDAAAQLGYSEAESLKDIPETGEDWFRKAELKDGRKQKG